MDKKDNIYKCWKEEMERRKEGKKEAERERERERGRQRKKIDYRKNMNHEDE